MPETEIWLRKREREKETM